MIGGAGSGKTTFATRLAERTGLALIDTDRYRTRPGWEPVPDDEFEATLRGRMAASPGGWVIEGLHSAFHSMMVEAADTVVLLDFPFATTYPRIVRRSFRRARSREVMSHGNVLRWRDVFGPRSMLIRGVVYYPRGRRQTREAFAEASAEKRRIRVFDQEQADALVELLVREMGAGR